MDLERATCAISGPSPITSRCSHSEDNFERRQAYNRVIEALQSESDGIQYQTFSLCSVLMTEKSPLTPDGLLKFWADEAYKKLADEKDTKYHTLDYVQELDTNVAAVAILLQLGMQLSMYISPSTSISCLR